MRLLLTASVLAAVSGLSNAAEPAAHAASAASAASSPERQYTFSWKFLDESTLAPRGGSTRGAALTLDKQPGDAWKKLQQPGLTRFEKDRAAILAMAGGYRASFDFIETAGFADASKPDRPYQSWGTEKVYVVSDNGRNIVLQHLLVMSMVGPDGKVEGPFVTKHWRQDWSFEPTHRIVYRGDNTWQRVRVPREQSAGRWSQTVYQVDDSPRYSGLANWQHVANHSSWSDADGWRPLPRREFSVRNDYQVLIGDNRHTITPTGWLHEQHNLKAVLDAKGRVSAVVGQETGLNRYERVTDVDWAAGDNYLRATAPVWAAVRNEWDRLFLLRGTLVLKGAPDKNGLFIPLYEYAETVAEANQPLAPADVARRVRDEVAKYLK
jgi:uncharacterized protein DUF6607